MNITDINKLIYAAATIMTQTLNEPSKRRKNRRDVKFWKIRMQSQISSWRKELLVIVETGRGSDDGKRKRKTRKIFQKYRVTNAREIAQLTETLKQKVQAKAQRIRRFEKRETQYSHDRMHKEETKKFYRNLGITLLNRNHSIDKRAEQSCLWMSSTGN